MIIRSSEMTILLTLIVGSFFLSSTPSKANELTSIKFVTGQKQNEFGYQLALRVLQEACRRNGIACTAFTAPRKRTGRLIVAGDADGELNRIRAFNQFADHRHLYRIEEPTQYTQWIVVAKGVHKIESWTDIINSKKKVIFLRGGAVIENALTSKLDKKYIMRIDTSKLTALKLLLAERGDYAIFGGLDTFDALMRQPEWKDTRLVRSPPIESIASHGFLHKKYAKIADKLSQSIKGMKVDGTYYTILQGLRDSYNPLVSE